MESKVLEVVKVIRTLLTSAKNGLHIQEIIDDYKQIEGKPIPLNALGYNTLEDFLRDTNQFALIETRQGTMVISKPFKDLYANQSIPNSPSKGKKKSIMIPPQRALRSTTENHWNVTAYSQAYTEMQNRSVKKAFTHPAKLLQATYSNSGFYRPILKQSNIKQVPRDESQNSTANALETISNSNNITPSVARSFQIREQSNHQNNVVSNTATQIDRISKKSIDLPSSTKTSVQSRLEIQKNILIDVPDSVPSQATTVPQYSSLNGCESDQKMKNVASESFDIRPFIHAVTAYCRQKGYAEPTYTFSRTKARKFTCKVTVGMAIYASYPNEFNTQAEAQEEASRIAFENIKEMEYREKYPICMDSSAEIANKIFECISENGVFLKFIPQLFQEKYDAILPDGWMDVIENSRQMFSIAKDALMDRVYPNITNQKSDNDSAEQKLNELEELILPFNEKHWNVFITSVSSTVDIWGRLIGAEYSAKLDSILDDIETELIAGGSKTICNNLTVGKYCYITNPDCYRVRIEKIDENQKMALCFLIDYGDEEWWAINQIYEGDAKLFSLPEQAIRFSLFNLEDFAENRHAKQEVDEFLAGKTLIAEVKSTQAEYLAQCESSVDAKIKAVFYDTTSDEDVQLNKMILEKICEKIETPQLQRSKWNPVIVSHVSDSGDIYVQLSSDKGNTVHNIKQLIHRLTQNGISNQFTRTKSTNNDYTANDLYLVQETSNLKWYRAAILPTKSTNSTTELCKYVDYGMTKNVPCENIYRLDLLSAALNKYPHQAIHVRLNDVTNYNPKIVARLRGLLCSGAPVLAQIANCSSMVQMVNICKRLPENNILCNINDTIRMEQEIESSLDLLLESENTTVIQLMSPKESLVIGKAEFRLYPEPPLDKYFNVIVVTAPSPSNFFVRPCREESGFKDMMLSLRSFCDSFNQKINISDVQVNQYYAGQLQDGYFYRVKIENILPADTVCVYKCDFGDINFLNTDALRPLGSEFRKIPQLAIPAKMHGIQPKNNVWNNDDRS
ncbi:tudor domain-containing protein 7A-like isoform X3 [Contarinia nasturtii]|uniref:tudor domain-containing protein 7A-like isoform X3 n=1 Tax=Contarinia nasturtii TaxID=265458 RepID=UPI0012D4796A|nr:tudor domain-containing protein 7A-like isoform X3 [Contarinia nasturtii]